MTDVSWSELYRCRREVNARYPTVFTLPTVRRAARLALPHLRPGVRILEIGGGSRPRGSSLAKGLDGARVVSVDPDPAGGHDHATVGEVSGTYDLAIALEVIEHIDLEGGLRMLQDVRDRLADDGVLLVSTPNVFCPGRFLRDATHVTPYAFDELGGALLLTGFGDPDLYRVVPGNLARRMGRALLSPLGLALGIDHAPSIAAVARR